MNEKVVIYSRVSTIDQKCDNQISQLKEIVAINGWQLVDVFVDNGISGTKGRDERPEFGRMCTEMVQRRFNRILVWDVSRLGRSLQHLVDFLNDVHSLGINLYIHQSGLDTSTPSGRMMFQMIGVFAEFERSMISERVKLGLQKVRKNGKQLGRPRTVTPTLENHIRQLLHEGKSYSYIQAELGASKSTISRIKNEHITSTGA